MKKTFIIRVSPETKQFLERLKTRQEFKSKKRATLIDILDELIKSCKNDRK